MGFCWINNGLIPWNAAYSYSQIQERQMPHAHPTLTPSTPSAASTDSTNPTKSFTAPLRDVQLKDNVWATQGTVLVSGTQALVRLMLMQRQHDERLAWNTRGFISGYRGSPLGMVDQVIWKQGE
eukprot:gene57460-76721_t